MKLYSTNNREKLYSLKEAVIRGIAPDGGLFMPTSIPQLSSSFFHQLPKMTFGEHSYAVAKALIGDSIPEKDLQLIIDHALTFPAPLVQLSSQVHVLELWHGPSLAFKDFGAQFMAQVMAYFNEENDKPLNILVATSGDTGGAVAAGFHQVPGINVVILFPKGKVSQLQELQLTTFGDNVMAVEIDGSFDDCQALVKESFNDQVLSAQLRLTSANSINISRLIPQSFYYFEALKPFLQEKNQIVVSVPSGNFGNLTAGLIARKMGLPIEKFIAATNVNDIVPEYLRTGQFLPRPSIETISNAMDVGNPSNFARMQEFFSSTWNNMKSEIIGFSYSDQQTLEAIQKIYETFNYLADPHSAIAYLGLMQYIKNQPSISGIFLETAHPSKFKTTIDRALNIDTPIHPALTALSNKKSHKVSLSKNFSTFSEFLLSTL